MHKLNTRYYTADKAKLEVFRPVNVLFGDLSKELILDDTKGNEIFVF